MVLEVSTTKILIASIKKCAEKLCVIGGVGAF